YGFFKAEDDTPFIAMELLMLTTTGKPKTLADVFAEHDRLEPRRLLPLVRDVASGLSAAHAQNIIHRDLKPANVCLVAGEDGTEHAKVIDFGIAKVLNGPGLTETGDTLGTPDYMSPEQFRTAKVADKRSDVYSLGVILYEGLSGRRPFESASPTEMLRYLCT